MVGRGIGLNFALVGVAGIGVRLGVTLGLRHIPARPNPSCQLHDDGCRTGVVDGGGGRGMEAGERNADRIHGIWRGGFGRAGAAFATAGR